jgi:NitT/TauT family transport system permease protein
MLGMNDRQLLRHVYLGSAAGLGYRIAQAEGVFDVTGVFSGMLILAIFVIVIDAFVSLAEAHLLKWRPRETVATAQA